MQLKRNGLLTKPIHGQTLRLTPPLGIKDRELKEASTIFRNVCNKMIEEKQNSRCDDKK